MKQRLFLGLLLVLNLILIACLFPVLKPTRIETALVSTVEQQNMFSSTKSNFLVSSATSQPGPAKAAAPGTPFTQMYSTDTRQFAANLRAIRCPEETVKDIIVAEISRRYKAQEEALRPKPADHVPIGWSSSTTEGKLLERRHQATVLAREKASLTQEALGYSVPVSVPLYATTAADQRFEEQLANLPEPKRNPMRQIHEEYWAKVQSLHERTKGFWQAEDVADLNQLKSERQEASQKLLNGL